MIHNIHSTNPVFRRTESKKVLQLKNKLKSLRLVEKLFTNKVEDKNVKNLTKETQN